MVRRTKIIAFSLLPEINQKVESLLKDKHKTRSEFFRELIDLYFKVSQSYPTSLPEADLAKILKSYWDFK